MKKKIAVIFSLLLCCVVLGACTSNVMIVKNPYNDGIANFYQYFLTNFYDGLDVQSSALAEIKYVDETKIDEASFNATALLHNQQYVMSSINTFIAGSIYEDLYTYNVDGTDEMFAVRKNSIPYTIGNSAYSEFEISKGNLSVTKVYVRQNSSVFEVAVPTSADGEYKFFTVEYSDGYLAISAKKSGVIYRNEVIFDSSGVMYVTLNAGGDLHYELILGSQSAEMRYTVNFAKSGKIISSLTSTSIAKNNFAKEDYYTNSVCGKVLFDGRQYSDDLANFDATMKNNESYKVKYQSYLDVIELLKI